MLKRLFKIGRLYYKYWLGKGESYYPTLISFNLIHRCNLRCKMCGQWGESGNLKALPKEQLNEILSFEDLKRTIDEVSLFDPYIYIWGGEPFLHPDIMEFIKYVIEEKRLKCGINTNGTYLNIFAAELVGLRNKFELMVSIDGPEEIHDFIRGKNGAFKEATSGIRAIQGFKKAKTQKYPHISVVATITNESFKFINHIADIAKDLDIDYLILSVPSFTTREMCVKQSLLTEEIFGCKADSCKGFLIDISAIDGRFVEDTIRRLLKKETRIKIKLDPEVKIKHIKKYFSDVYFTGDKKICISPWHLADIRPNGDITFCPDFPDYILGNIKKEPFLIIWNSKRARDFRTKLRKYKRFPICSRCCHLYKRH